MLPLAIALVCTTPGSGLQELRAQLLPRSRVERWRRARVLSRRDPKPEKKGARVQKPRKEKAAARRVERVVVARRRTVMRLSRVRAAFDSQRATVLPQTWAPTPPPARAAARLPWPRETRRRPDQPLTGNGCLAKLRALGVPHKAGPQTRGITTPVLLTGVVNGLKLTPMWGKRPRLMDCRFAVVLHEIAAIARRIGFNEFRYSSFYSYRNIAGSRRLSRHANGLAVDVHELRGPGGLRASVLKDWVKAGGRPGDCVGDVKQRKARLLRSFACELERSGLLYLILTPDSDYAHRNHFHLSGLRRGQRPLRGRYAGRRYRRRP